MISSRLTTLLSPNTIHEAKEILTANPRSERRVGAFTITRRNEIAYPITQLALQRRGLIRVGIEITKNGQLARRHRKLLARAASVARLEPLLHARDVAANLSFRRGAPRFEWRIGREWLGSNGVAVRPQPIMS